ncbi:hypothetical protein JXA05_02300 [Candidatus Peregrinibacteria bacterium]|nr:hypothetical protein [Candidatus Peregrinibacteria bacterium]
MKNIVSELKTALQVILFNEKAMHEVAADKNKTKFGFAVIIVAAFLGVIGQQLFMGWLKPSFGYGLMMGVTQIIGVTIGIYVISFVAVKIFKGQVKHDAFFRVAAYGMLLGWASIIPMLGIISALWGLALLFVILTKVHKVTVGGAIGTILISLVVLMAVSAILSPAMSRFGYKAGMGGAMNYHLNMGPNSYNFQINP